MKNTLPLTALTLILFIFTACNDKLADGGSGPGGNPTVSDLLSEKKWKLLSMSAIPGMIDPIDSTKRITDLYSLMDECDKDDLTLFKKGGMTLLDHGAVLCLPDENQIDSSDVWRVSDDKSYLITTSPTDGTISWKIIAITSTSATLSTTRIEDGVSQEMTIKVGVVP